MDDSQQADDPTTGEPLTPARFQNLKTLASTDFGRFAVEVQHASEEIRLKLIEQLPEFNKLASTAVNAMTDSFTATLKSFDAGDIALRAGFEQWRDSLITVLELPDLTFEQQLEVTKEIGRTVELQAEKEAEAKGAKAKLFERLTIGIGVAAGVVILAVVGGKMGLEQGGADKA